MIAYCSFSILTGLNTERKNAVYSLLTSIILSKHSQIGFPFPPIGVIQSRVHPQPEIEICPPHSILFSSSTKTVSNPSYRKRIQSSCRCNSQNWKTYLSRRALKTTIVIWANASQGWSEQRRGWCRWQHLYLARERIEVVYAKLALSRWKSDDGMSHSYKIEKLTCEWGCKGESNF